MPVSSDQVISAILPQHFTASLIISLVRSVRAVLPPAGVCGSSTVATRIVTPEPRRKHFSRKYERGACQPEVTNSTEWIPLRRTISLVLKTSSKVERLLAERRYSIPAGLPNCTARVSRSCVPRPLMASFAAEPFWASEKPVVTRFGAPGKTMIRSAFDPLGAASGTKRSVASGSAKHTPARVQQMSIIFIVNITSPLRHLQLFSSIWDLKVYSIIIPVSLSSLKKPPMIGLMEPHK